MFKSHNPSLGLKNPFPSRLFLFICLTVFLCFASRLLYTGLFLNQKERGRGMGRAPCCDKANVKRGPWSPEEDTTLKNYIHNHGSPNNWIALPHKAGLKRCGKSCRLRWLNYLRPDIKHGGFTDHEDYVISSLYSSLGSRWSVIASQLPGRTDNDVKNYWNTKLKKKLLGGTVGLNTHAATANQFPVSTELLPSSTNSSHCHLETIDSQVPLVDHPIPQLPPLPSPPEGSDFRTNGSYSSGNSSSLGASSLSASSSLAMDSSWSGNGEEEFPMDLCFGFLEEQIKEVDDPTLGIPPLC